MSTTFSTTPETREVPPLGGFSLTFLRLEFQRLLRNKRAVFFTLFLPSAFFLAFGSDSSYKHESAGVGNVTASVMISMAVYGGMLATTSGGAMVATERALGWSRQLRLTPLTPLAYVAIKAVVAMAMGLLAMLAVFVVGNLIGADMPFDRMVAAGLIGWVCTLVFAAFGLFVGYLLPSENVMQVLGPALAALALAGGLFVPLNDMSSVFQDIAHYTPAYGVGVLARSPLGDGGNIGLAVLNVVVWAAIFIGGAAWRMSNDTKRV